MNNSKELLVFGAGGHGKVVAEVASRAGFRVTGFIDDSADRSGGSVCGLPILGNREWLRSASPFRFSVALAIGNNHLRRDLAQWLVPLKLCLTTVISPAAMVSSSARIGQGSIVMPGAIISADATVGPGCIVNSGAIVEHDVVLGNYVHISPNTVLAGEVTVGDATHVGIGVAVLPQIHIGSSSVVGAGSVVTRDVPDRVVAYGCPARVQGTYDQPGQNGLTLAVGKGGRR